MLHRNLDSPLHVGRVCRPGPIRSFAHSRRLHLPLLAWLGLFFLSLGGGVAAQQSHPNTGCVIARQLGGENELRLAVEQEEGWLICQSNTPDTVHEIDISPGRDVQFRWGAPKSRNREVVYISTIAKANHPLSLQRNSAAGILGMFVPFVGENWEREFHANQKQGFVKYHVPEIDPGTSLAADDEFRQWLDRWHNTSLWFANRDTDEVVRSTLLDEDKNAAQRGAERLIRLQARRLRTSWIPFSSQEPYPRGAVLRVLISYSGQGNRVQRYYFKEKD